MRHVMGLDRQLEPREELARAFGLWPALSRRIVARHLHQLGKKLRLARKLAIDERGHDLGERHDVSASRSTASSMTRAAISASSAVMISRGEWLTPPFPQRTNNMAM